MTLVIATRGIDLSVGAVAAIAGAVACTTIASARRPDERLGRDHGRRRRAGALRGARPLERLPRRAPRHPADHRDPGPHDSRPRHRAAHHRRPDHHRATTTFREIGAGFLLLPFSILIALAVLVAVALVTRRTALGLLIESVGGNPEASRLAGIRSRTIIWTVYVFAALCAGVAGLMISSNVSAADANNAGLWIELDAILAVVIGGTSLAGGRYSLAGTLVGALIIQTLTTTVYTMGIAPEMTLVFKAVVVIAVCLLQAPKVRERFRAAAGDRGVGTTRPADDRTAPTSRPGAEAPDTSRADPPIRRREAEGGPAMTTTLPEHRRRRTPRLPAGRGATARSPAASCPSSRPSCSSSSSSASGSVRYDGFALRPGLRQPLHRQRLPDRARGRHDLRHPHRRHRPLGRVRSSRCRRWWPPRRCEPGCRRRCVIAARARDRQRRSASSWAASSTTSRSSRSS